LRMEVGVGMDVSPVGSRGIINQNRVC
jgi:hypothetical protein